MLTSNNKKKTRYCGENNKFKKTHNFPYDQQTQEVSINNKNSRSDFDTK